MKKNYIILIILLSVTVILTLGLSKIYLSKNKKISKFYEYANKIKVEDFDIYVVENPDSIIYISDKYDLSHEKFEEIFKSKIDELNLKDKLVYMDKNDMDSNFIKKINNKYKINLNINKFPVVIIIIDNKAIKNVYIDNEIDPYTFIDYKVFK